MRPWCNTNKLLLKVPEEDTAVRLSCTTAVAESLEWWKTNNITLRGKGLFWLARHDVKRWFLQIDRSPDNRLLQGLCQLDMSDKSESSRKPPSTSIIFNDKWSPWASNPPVPLTEDESDWLPKRVCCAHEITHIQCELKRLKWHALQSWHKCLISVLEANIGRRYPIRELQ